MKEEDNSNFSDWRERRRSNSHGIGALILITVGLIFLLNNFGILPFDVWANLWRFWPVILILIGVQMVLGKGSVANVIVLIIGLFFIGIVLLMSLAPSYPSVNQWVNQYMPGLQINRMPMHGIYRFDNQNMMDQQGSDFNPYY